MKQPRVGGTQPSPPVGHPSPVGRRPSVVEPLLPLAPLAAAVAVAAAAAADDDDVVVGYGDGDHDGRNFVQKRPNGTDLEGLRDS